MQYIMRNLIFTIAIMLLCLLAPVSVNAAHDPDAEIALIASDGADTGPLQDSSYYTSMSFKAGSNLKVISPSQKPLYGLYFEWDTVPGKYTVRFGDTETVCGTEGFLHEFVAIDGGAVEIIINFDSDASLSGLCAFNTKGVPDSVQLWEPPCGNADILVVSTHSDDEILFLGGVLAEYAGERGLDVQVLYFFDYTNTWRVREHEKLDGLWEIGIRHYPDKGCAEEKAVGNLDSCKKIYGYNNSLGWLVSKIRQYKPLVCVAQDVNGEYGHTHHLMVVNMVRDAVAISGSANIYPDSAAEYGAYNVPKTYLHLWRDNPIVLDTRKPLAEFGGLTAFDVASKAYSKHVSQQKFWFYVSDDNKYSIAEFGLFRSTVGADTSNDMMEHLTPYPKNDDGNADGNNSVGNAGISTTAADTDTAATTAAGSADSDTAADTTAGSAAASAPHINKGTTGKDAPYRVKESAGETTAQTVSANVGENVPVSIAESVEINHLQSIAAVELDRAPTAVMRQKTGFSKLLRTFILAAPAAIPLFFAGLFIYLKIKKSKTRRRA